MIRVLLAEDQRMMLDALAQLLALEDDIAVCGKATSAEEVLSTLTTTDADVLVTDIEMGSVSGLELAHRLRKDAPALKVIILTTFSRSGYLQRARDAGVSGYLLKDSSPAELADVIRRVHAGGYWIDPELAQKAWTPRDPLTERQREVIRLIARGMSNAEIAEVLALSEGTVRNYVHDAMSRLNAKSRTDAVRIAHDEGWL